MSGMRLELATSVVRDVRLSERTRCVDGVLEVEAAALRALVLEDEAFADVAIDIVRPGDATRIIHVMDVAEPRWKPEPGSTFPTFTGPPRSVGDGLTRRLEGVAVVAASDAVAGEPTYWREAIIDMQGPGAETFGKLINIVLTFQPSPAYRDATRPDAVIDNIMVGSSLAQRYNRSVRVAELKTAALLARTAAGVAPDRVRAYELTPAAAGLPKVVYFYQVSGAVVYGAPLEGMLPTLIHPNELLDGALVNIRSNL